MQRRPARPASQAGAAQGGGTIFTEPILVVNQKAKLIEVNNEYAIFDQHGRQIGAVRQVGPEHGQEGHPRAHLATTSS